MSDDLLSMSQGELTRALKELGEVKIDLLGEEFDPGGREYRIRVLNADGRQITGALDADLDAALRSALGALRTQGTEAEPAEQ